MENGFAAPGSVTARTAGVAARPVVTGAAATTAMRGAASAERQAAETLTSEQRTAGFFQGISQKANMIWSAQILLIPGILLAKMGFKKTGAALKIGYAPIEAGIHTNIGEVSQLRSNVLASAAEKTQITGGGAHQWTGKLVSAAEHAAADDAKRAVSAGAKLAPLRASVGKHLDGIASTGFGKFLEVRLRWVAQWRVNANTKNLEKGLATGKEALAKLAEKHSIFAPLLDSTDHVAVSRGIEELVRSGGLVKGQAIDAYRVRDTFRDLGKASVALESHTQALGQGLRGLVGNLGKMGGRVTVIQGVVAVGAAATMFGAFAMAKHENKTAKAELDKLAADLGDANAPILEAARRMAKKQRGGRGMAAVASGLGEATMVGMVGSSLGGGAAMAGMMGMQMGLPMVGQMLVPENPFLNATANLRKAETTNQTIPANDKIAMVRNLVAAVPDVAKNGGFYNRLSAPVAEAIVGKKLSLRDTLRLLNNPTQFTALAAEVKSAVEAKKAAAAAHQPKVAERPVLVAPTDDHGPMQAGKPGMHVQAADRALEGRIEGQQRSLA